MTIEELKQKEKNKTPNVQNDKHYQNSTLCIIVREQPLNKSPTIGGYVERKHFHSFISQLRKMQSEKTTTIQKCNPC